MKRKALNLHNIAVILRDQVEKQRSQLLIQLKSLKIVMKKRKNQKIQMKINQEIPK